MMHGQKNIKLYNLVVQEGVKIQNFLIMVIYYIFGIHLSEWRCTEYLSSHQLLKDRPEGHIFFINLETTSKF